MIKARLSENGEPELLQSLALYGTVIDGGHVWGREAVKGREESLFGDVCFCLSLF